MGAAAQPAGPKPGCQTNAWRVQPGNFGDFLKALDRVHHYGYEGFETGFRNIENRLDHARETRSEFDKRGLLFLGCHIFLTQYDPASSIAPADLIARIIKTSAALGAQRLILSGAGATGDRAALDRKIKALAAAGRQCRQAGIGLAYHNHDVEFLGENPEIEEMLRRGDPSHLSLVLDAGHALRTKADVADFFHRHDSRIAGIHLRDFRSGDQVPFGQGEIDWSKLAAAIRRRNWTGWVITEEERLNDVKPGDAAVEPARRGMKKIFGV